MIRTILAASILTLLLISGGKAEQNIPDLGAGPIRIGITSCLLFKKHHQGPPCIEPEVLTTGVWPLSP